MNRKLIGALTVSAGLVAGSAQAGLWDNLYQGLQYAAIPSGSNVFSTGDGGSANGQRNGRLRIAPNRAGRGINLEFDRTFGLDTRGRPEVLDFGALELELQGSVQATAGYTRRGFYIGNADFSANNLSYSVRGKTGAQDAELRGVMNVQNSIEVNQFGFYDVSINIDNSNSQLLLDGVVARAAQDSNFTIGPINVKGNIFVDMAVGLLGQVGVDTTGLEQLFPKSPIDQLQEQLARAFDLESVVAGATVENAELLAKAQDSLVSSTLRASDDSAAQPVSAARIPEPGTLLLLAGGGLAAYGAQRRRTTHR